LPELLRSSLLIPASPAVGLSRETGIHAGMNDPTVLEASRVLATNLDAEKNQVKDKVIKAFRLIVCRKPTEKEIVLLSSYYNDQLIAFKKEQSRADKLLAVGEYPIPAKMNKTSVAAMMQVITALYNLEETITKS
jgi:hypothetical protein